MSTDPGKTKPSSGRKEVLRQLYEKRNYVHLKKIVRANLDFRILWKMTSSDATQDVIVVLWQMIERGKVPADADIQKLWPLLKAIAKMRNLQLVEDYIETGKRNVAQEEDPARNETEVQFRADLLSNIPDLGSQTPLDAAIWHERLSMLTPEESCIFTMRVEGMTYREMGEHMGCSEEKARQRLIRICKRFYRDEDPNKI
jgi:DNA-directed RNA polymerase specialized sigma24 family protein